MLINATKEYLAQLDEKAEQMKQRILNTESNYPRHAAVIYYVSNNGNDENDGLSPEAPIASLEKVNSLKLNPGEVVLFERGGLWRGQLVTQPAVTYSAYGKGRKPRFYGVGGSGAGAENWTLTDKPNVWEFSRTIETDVGLIVFNDGEAIAYKRYTPEENTRADGIGDFAGFEDFTQDLQFWHRKTDNKVFVYSTKGNPAERFERIELCAMTTIVTLGAHGVIIDNLCVRYSGSHCLSWANAWNLTVRNCEIGYGGGSFLGKGTRYGNACEMYINCDGLNVHDNYIYQMYDTGLTFQFWDQNEEAMMANISYENNLIEYCYWNIEYVSRGKYTEKNRMSHVIMRNNFLRHAGYGWGDVRFNSDHSAHIQGWAIENPADNFIIENNILDRAKHLLINCGAEKQEYLPIMKNNTYIQTKGQRIGYFSVNFEDSEKTKLLYATDGVDKIIEESFPEENPTVVLVDEELVDYRNNGVKVFVKD